MSSATIAAPVATPYRIAEETYVLPHPVDLGPLGFVSMNTMLIRGKEPVVVDTTGELLRDEYFQQLGSLVDIEDIRWIYISHDDHDHTGNMMELLERAPRATLVGTQFMVERLSLSITLPLERMRWVNDGDTFSVGDRTLVAVRPPIFDSPVTRGLFDPTTGVYWGGDSFAALSPEPVENAADIPADAYAQGSLAVHSLISPWHQWLDPVRYGKHIDRIESLPITVVASGHGPATYRETLPAAFELFRKLPSFEPFLELTQRDLEAMLAGTAVAA
jgi:flavorubredoxin